MSGPLEGAVGTELRRDEIAALRAYESAINDGLAQFIIVGTGLAAIRDSRLYRATHATFEDYLIGRWHLTRSRAYQIIDAAQTAVSMSQILDTPLVIESQAAALSKLPIHERAEAWNEAVESAPRNCHGKPKMTAAHVGSVVKQRRTPAPTHPKSMPRARSPSSPADAPGTDKTRPIGLNDAVEALRLAVEHSTKDTSTALNELRKSVAAGLYRPENRNAPLAVLAMVELIALLLGRQL